MPQIERHSIAGAMTAVHSRRTLVPLVELELLLPAGGDRNPADRPGLAQLTASLIDEGTAHRAGPEIAAELERRGGQLSSSCDWNAASIRLSLPASELDFGLELAAELLYEPSFPEREVERLRRQFLAEIERRVDQPAVLAEEALARGLFRGTVYGEMLLGTSGSIAAITRREIEAFHRQHYRPDGARLVLAGDFEPEHALSAADRLFSRGATGRSGPDPIVTAPLRDRVEVVVIDRPRAAQTELRVGQVGITRTDPDRTAIGFLNTLLGGKFTSRINLNLRERLGITYGAFSRLADRRSRGPYVVSAAVTTSASGLAASEILAELRRLREEPIAPEEIEETRSYLLGIFPYGLQTVEGLAARLRDIALFDLPLDHPRRVLEEYGRLGSADMARVAAAHIHPESTLVVAAGPAGEVAAQLEPLGPVRVERPEDAAGGD